LQRVIEAGQATGRKLSRCRLVFLRCVLELFQILSGGLDPKEPRFGGPEKRRCNQDQQQRLGTNADQKDWEKKRRRDCAQFAK